MDKAKHIRDRMGVLMKRSEERNYIYRDYRIKVVSTKEDGTWKVSGKLELAVSEELDNPEAVVETPLEVMVTDDDYGEALSTVFFNLNFIPQNFKDAIFEEGFFELLNEADEFVEEQEAESKEGQETVLM